MLKEFRRKVAKAVAPEYVGTLERGVLAMEELDKSIMEEMANRRVAEIMAKMDPFEPVMKLFHGIFSEEFEKPDEKLDAKGQLGLCMWAYQAYKDPYFTYLVDWVMNSTGNETLKRAPVTPERILYGRAQISNMVLFKREVGRLSGLYEEMLERNKVEAFDEHLAIE